MNSPLDALQVNFIIYWPFTSILFLICWSSKWYEWWVAWWVKLPLKSVLERKLKFETFRRKQKPEKAQSGYSVQLFSWSNSSSLPVEVFTSRSRGVFLVARWRCFLWMYIINLIKLQIGSCYIIWDFQPIQISILQLLQYKKSPKRKSPCQPDQRRGKSARVVYACAYVRVKPWNGNKTSERPCFPGERKFLLLLLLLLPGEK